ncbi:MAG: TetR/AcrR family transcriptional regulator, partial [Candidatus Spyradocola sp.]
RTVVPIMARIYRISEQDAIVYFRSMWLAVHSLSTLIVTGSCPYTDAQIRQMLTGFSLSTCKAIKEIPGFAAGDYDTDALFRAMTGRD